MYAGCDRPLVRPQEVAASIHGQTGLDGVELPVPTRPLEDMHAVNFIVKTIMENEPGTITLGIAFLAAYLAINEIEKLAGANWILVVVLIVIAAVFFVVFWRHEGSAAAPMVSTHYMKQRRTWGLLVTTLLGLAFGPVAGVLASKFGYHVVLRAGLVVTIVGALFGIFVANNPSIAALVVISVVLGISYAGTANIMLNGLGIVLSPKDNPGYLPGMNAGALVAARANGTAAQDAMRLATRASALATTRVGAQQSIPTLAEANSLE